MNYRYTIPGFTALVLSTCNLILQAQAISVNKLDIPQLTSTGWITGFTQDSSGYMWFSSAGGGVFRYDGYTLTDFKNQPANPNSISSDRVECVATGKNGVIWFGNFASGIDRFDTEKGRFKNFRNEINNKSSLINDTITALLVDHGGNLWIGTANGLDRYDEKENRFIHYIHDEKNPSSISHDVVRTLYEDRKGVLWVGTGTSFDNGRITKQGGLNKLDKKTGRFTRYMHNDNEPTTLADNRVRAIFEDSRGIFWVGTAGDGLHTMDREKGKFERHFYDPKFPEKLSRPALTQRFDWADDHITFINEDATGAIVIGTFGAGLSRYDPQTKKIARYNNFSDSAANNRLSWWAFKSRDNILWLSTWLGGVYQLNLLSKKFFFQSYGLRVFTVSQVSPGVFWFSGPNGLIQENQKSNKREIYECDTLRAVSNDRMIMLALAPDKAGNVWLGTADGNIFKFEKDAKRFKDYNRNKSLQGEPDRPIYSLCVDKNDNLWIGSETGLEYLDTKSGHFTYYHGNNKQASPKHIFNLIEDRNGNIWTASFLEGGINLLNKQTGQFENYLGNKGITSQLFEDGKGDLWAGTNEGLYRKELGRQEFTLFPNPELSQCMVSGIIEDYRKNLWVVTTKGMFKIDPGRNRVSRFGKIHGFNEDQVGERISLGIGANGKDILGFVDLGYFSVNPDDLIAEATPPQVHIYGFNITNTNSKQGTGRNVSGYLRDVKKEIILNYNENSFSFEITPIHFSSPADNKAEYQLHNYDPEWRVSKVGQKAYYFNIPPGKYILKIRAYNSNGVMSEKDIVIIINPPWWRTWWAYTLYAIIFILASLIANRIIRNRILEKERSKNREKELEHAKEIEKAYHELKLTQAQLIQSEKMASLGELTAGIAHEIQNPLNFVNNFSEVNRELVDELQQELKAGKIEDAISISNDIKENEEKINHHGKRADTIVKGMLQHSRTSSGQKQPTDINALADEYLRLAYHGMRAKDKTFNTTTKTDFDNSIGKINIIPQDIGRAILNLINNAFYAVSEKQKQNQDRYEPTLILSTKKVNDKIEISVKDNGNGIPQKVLDKIFQPFFTTKPTGQGTGLGLSLSYDIIKALGGEIKVETNEGEGARFIIIISTK